MKYIVGAVVVIIAALAAVIMLSSRPTPTSTGTKAKTSTNLVEYADRFGSEVSMTTQGKIVGQDDFRSIRVTVNQYSRTVEVLKGYDNSVEKTQQYTNSKSAYDVFLRSLANSGFIKTRATSFSDERGVCPLSSRYIYLLQENGKDIHRSWSASCGNSVGSFAGVSATVKQLFQNQVPDYNKFVQGVQL